LKEAVEVFEKNQSEEVATDEKLTKLAVKLYDQLDD